MNLSRGIPCTFGQGTAQALMIHAVKTHDRAGPVFLFILSAVLHPDGAAAPGGTRHHALVDVSPLSENQGNDPEEVTARYVVRAFPCVRQRRGNGAGVCDGAGMSSILIISSLA